MEHSEIISSIITAIATLFVGGGAFFAGRYNSKTNKTSTILEEQYLKVISPIHRALICGKKKDVLDIVGKEEIDKIIIENYHLLPDGLYDDYIEYVNGMDVIGDFKKKINEYNRILRSKLGYSKIRLTKDEKEAAKRLADSKHHAIIIFLVFALCFFVGLLLLLNFSDVKLNSEELRELSVSLFFAIVAILIEIISTFAFYIKTK